MWRWLLHGYACDLLLIDEDRVRAPHLVVRVDHDHLAYLLFHEAVKQLICEANRVLLKSVGNVHSLLDGRVGRLAEDPVHHAFVDLVGQDDRGEDVACEPADDPLDKLSGVESYRRVVKRARLLHGDLWERLQDACPPLLEVPRYLVELIVLLVWEQLFSR